MLYYIKHSYLVLRCAGRVDYYFDGKTPRDYRIGFVYTKPLQNFRESGGYYHGYMFKPKYYYRKQYQVKGLRL